MEPRDFISVKEHALLVTGSNWTTEKAFAKPYRDLNGNWFVHLEIAGNISVASATLTLTVQGLTFFRIGAIGQAVAFSSNGANLSVGVANPNASTIYLEFSATRQYIAINADVKLASKPSFME